VLEEIGAEAHEKEEERANRLERKMKKGEEADEQKTTVAML